MTTKPPKLSAAERKLLREICYNPKQVPAHTVSAKQLVSKRLAFWSVMTSRLNPTSAGLRVNELSE